MLNGENTADWPSPSSGRPAIRYGFHSGTPGSCERVNCSIG